MWAISVAVALWLKVEPVLKSIEWFPWVECSHRSESAKIGENIPLRENKKKSDDSDASKKEAEKAETIEAPKETQEQMMAEDPTLVRDWDEEIGDRMVKLVFIGKDMDKDEIIKRINECLA